MNKRAGFTLLEVLVVLVIISVIISFAVLAIDTGPEELRREGNRIASLLELASEEAVMNGREYRVVLRQHSYSFDLLQEGKWQGVEDELFRPRQLPSDLSLQLFMENQEVPLNDEEDPETAKTAALLILSSGEMPPFELTVSGLSTTKLRIHSDGSEIETDFP
ncbi:MAG TPA: type II secretion system minor pseudopilin GspH [Desulfurivibrionaceae bacterium]|nr:type II secretion system minor pseudopilin GspH [Desulfurivibrionaceae bacterium]